jgi:tRNA(Arg) A34 adenosine deaminase TadA
MGAAGDSWAALPPGARAALEQQWAGVAVRALPCGSAVTDAAGDVIATGRNHAYDAVATSGDALQHTRLAHAEFNALARIDTDLDWAGLTLWCTQHPCSMCAAAASFTGIGRVVFAADDPSDDSTPADVEATRGTVHYERLGAPDWAVATTLLFLSTGAFLRGAEDRNVVLAGSNTPGVAALALDLAAQDHLGKLSAAGYPLPAALEPLWSRIVELSGDGQRWR